MFVCVNSLVTYIDRVNKCRVAMFTHLFLYILCPALFTFPSHNVVDCLLSKFVVSPCLMTSFQVQKQGQGTHFETIKPSQRFQSCRDAYCNYQSAMSQLLSYD